MCGIAGALNLQASAPVPVEALRAMLGSLRHRGPDEFGIYRSTEVGMASARLSIVDIQGGQQPISNEDGTLWIVFNGEIFNYVELRPRLEASGHHFSTESDTEVLLHLYEEEGPACLTSLNGQFALAIWDTRRKELFLARDRLGIRPLFYATVEGRLAFASEIKALAQLPGVELRIDREALRQILTYWSPLSPRTVFHGVTELPPGHFLRAREGRIEIERYWQPTFEEQKEWTEAECLEELDSLLVDATRIRLRADVPVGAYLSGGMDSSVIAAIIRKHSLAPLDTFSISFADSGYDESLHQRRMAQALGTTHQEFRCSQADIARVFPDVVWHAEVPILRTAPAPMFLLSELVHQHQYKVVLTGEGADEVLAGYDIFKEMRVRRFWARRPESQLRPALFRKLYPDIARESRGDAFWTAFFRSGLEQTESPTYSHDLRWSNTSRAQRFLAESNGAAHAAGALIPLPKQFAEWGPLSQAQYLEMVTFLSPYLLSSQGDRPAMAHSVEGRYPFLDYRVVEFCGRLPASMKQRGLQEKWLLRKLARRMLPKEIWQRTKRPYRAPIQRTFFPKQAREEAYVGELLSPEVIRRSGHFRPEAVERLVMKARSEERLGEVEEMALTGILSTQLVEEAFVRRGRPALTADKLTPLKMVEEPVLAAFPDDRSRGGRAVGQGRFHR